MTLQRQGGRAPDALRIISLTPNISRHAEGSCLACFGDTHVLCTASWQHGVPHWLKGSGTGWVTAEYGMLPRATHKRGRREAALGRPSGRTQEIQRLIGRSLRAVIDLSALGENQILLDCDVLQADGGTRTAAVTGAWVALALACRHARAARNISRNPVLSQVAAVSCGVHDGRALLDLDYEEDSSADLDANFSLSSDGGLIDLQCAGEKRPFSMEEFTRLTELAMKGCKDLFVQQAKCLDDPMS